MSDIFFMSTQRNEGGRGPKTELDEKFLSIARQVMKSHGVTSDRAISLKLGRKPDFINRISNGAQSATPEAWDALLNQYPEARSITNNTITQSGAHSIGNVEGDYHAPTLADCQQELAAARLEIERLKELVADRDRLIASQQVAIDSKEEILSLLRGGQNRPN